MADTYDLIIVGGGPAGMAAAIFGTQHGLKPVLIEQETYGGQIARAEAVENWPGDFLLTGPELSDRFRRHVERLEVTQLDEPVVQVNLAGPIKTVVTRGGNQVDGRAVILCPGAERRGDVKVARTEFLRGTGVALDAQGQILADPDTMATNIDGVFAAGDARRKWLKKLITAVADGAAAACAAAQYLEDDDRLRVDVLESEQPVLAVFWSPGSPGSLSVLEWAEAAAATAGGAWKLARIDISRSASLAKHLGVTDAPAVLLLQHGWVVDRLDANFADFSHWISERIFQPETIRR
ncbi:MAG TPA: FAD-dependent oxidoreductase [Symbiobacteriaceae bacterium]|jgi:pyruvate/2-oxoglutarate dehydrogenase complex dihydrolipoamide dehydrogenase (E3) component